MTLNKQSGNMYAFVTHTWNPIKGKCSHDCEYCYMKRWANQKSIRLVEKELKDDLGENNFIFVGSSTDMFAEDIPKEWIFKILDVCKKYPENKYLFQSKNPSRILRFINSFPKNFIIGTTIESNREYPQMGKTPTPLQRSGAMNQIKKENRLNKTMVTIEPIMDFDVYLLTSMIFECRPVWVNVGADSQNRNLPEPSKEKIEKLIIELSKFTEVKIKDNLKRLIK